MPLREQPQNVHVLLNQMLCGASSLLTSPVVFCAMSVSVVQGFDPVYGARPVKRALQRELQTLLAQAMLRGEFAEGDTIRVEAAADSSCLQLQKASSPEASKQQPKLANGTSTSGSNGHTTNGPEAAAAANGVANGLASAGSAGSAGAPPAGKKKVIRLVRKTKSTREGSGSVTPDQQQQMNGSGSGSSSKRPNGVVKSGSSGALQSMPISFGDSSDAEH